MNEPIKIHLTDDEQDFIARFANRVYNHEILYIVIAYYKARTDCYHDIRHVNEVYFSAQSMEFTHSLPKHIPRSAFFDMLAWACFCHDIVYKPGAKNNEELSAEVFKSLVTNFSVPFSPEQIDTIYQAIIDTAKPIHLRKMEIPHSESLPWEVLAFYLNAADLAGFNRVPEEFIKSELRIAKEFDLWNSPENRKARIAFLESIQTKEVEDIFNRVYYPNVSLNDNVERAKKLWNF